MKLSFRQRLFSYFAILVTLFTVGIGLFAYTRERAIKTEVLQEKLDVFANLIHSSLPIAFDSDSISLQKLEHILPPDLRITIIAHQGKVLYDNAISDYSSMQNHASRLEVQTALKSGFGTEIRESESTQQPYLYYAKKFDNHYIRVALPYDIQLQRFLKADILFLYFLIFIFLLSLYVIHKITVQFGNSIKRLRDFALHTDNKTISFSEDELGEIGKKIADNYHLLEENKKTLLLEKQKLLRHIQISEEGVCFISSANHIEFYNGLFIQYLNQLIDDSKSSPEVVLTDSVFTSLHQFLQQVNEKYFETKIEKQGKTFSLRANIFKDKSFEVILTDVSRQEKTKQLKQEITGNMAHELRTPITGVRAYLETILEQPLTDDQKQHFIRQAYQQTVTLSEMIKDMGLIAKMEEAPNSFATEKVNLGALLETLKAEQLNALKQKNIHLNWQLPTPFIINGNSNLLSSIFRNLIENSINYAGENIKIDVSLINEDQDFYYFSFYDTGVGVANEQKLNRLFERFYRVQEGRCRDTGGSGLGLSIVKNAILFHKGKITVKNRKEGGLEFSFHIKK